MELNERRALIDQSHPHFSQREQCKIFSLHRSGLYYEPTEPCKETLRLMHAIDEEYLENPHYWRRRMGEIMRARGFDVGNKKIRSFMRLMGLEAIYPKPNLSKPNKERKKYPYLLRGLKIDRPNQTWVGDITYIPLAHGFGYLFAIIDWFSRYVIEWELSSLLDSSFCVEALDRGLIDTRPEIFNTEKGVQFTSRCFVGRLEESEVKVIMDGKGRALDNVFIERLWRRVKYENVYPRGYETLKEVHMGLKSYFEYYNERRPHQGLEYRTPAEVYFAN